VKRTGAVNKSETIQTTRTALRQLLIVQTDRERIGNTITINLLQTKLQLAQTKITIYRYRGRSVYTTARMSAIQWKRKQNKRRGQQTMSQTNLRLTIGDEATSYAIIILLF